MKRQVEVVVFAQEQYNIREIWMPTNLVESITWMKGMLELIPVEYQQSAQIEIDSEDAYGNLQATIKIFYMREETDEEERRRIKQESANEEDRTRMEIAELKRLQEKYGVISG